MLVLFILAGCHTNQSKRLENTRLFSEVNDMRDTEQMVFYSFKSSNDFFTFNLYEDDEEMVTLINKVKNMNVLEDDSDVDVIREGEQPNSYLLTIIHDPSRDVYSTLSVNDEGTVYIWNRYTNGENPSLYVSKGNLEFYDQVARINEEEKERERHLNAISEDEINFEYKTEASSVLEIRSAAGKLIADLHDIQKDSLKVETNESGSPLLRMKFNDKEFVYRFTKAHVGEEIHVYVNGELVASPMIMEAFMTRELTMSGGFDEASLDELVKTIKEGDE